MSRIRTIDSLGRFAAHTYFVPFSGTGRQLKGGKGAHNERTGIPAVYTPVQQVSGVNMETLISRLQAATTAMEATASAVMTLHKKSEVHENKIKDLQQKIQGHTHPPPEPLRTSASVSVPHIDEAEEIPSNADSSFYNSQEGIAPQSTLNNNETPNILSNSWNSDSQDLRDPLKDISA